MSDPFRMMNCTSSHGLLAEMKAKQNSATVARAQRDVVIRGLELQKERLLARIEQVASREPTQSALFERAHLESQLDRTEQSIRMVAVDQMGDENQPHHGSEADQFTRFFHAVAEVLRKSDGRRCPLSHLLMDSKLAGRWNDLKRCRLIRKATEIKEILLEKGKKEFEIVSNAEGQQVVRFAGEAEIRPSLLPNPFLPPVQAGYPMGALPPVSGMLPLQNAGGAPGMLPFPSMPGGSSSSSQLALPLTPGMQGTAPGQGGMIPVQVLTPEQIVAVEGELAKNGGSERVRKLCLHLNLQEGQLARHFQLYEEGGKTFIRHLISEVSELELTLLNLSPRRPAIGEAMTFCLENASPTVRAAALAKALIRSFHVPELESEAIIARLYLISDVLLNARPTVKGSGTYRTVFEESLPDACEFLGSHWLRHPDCDRARAETIVKRTFDAWRSWDVFPAVYVNGLEALLLGPAPEEVPESVDAVLRQKLAEWCSEGKAAELPMAARRRGLSGKTLQVAACRKRLCVYERYWHEVNLEKDRVQMVSQQAHMDQAELGDDDRMEVEDRSIDGDSLNDEDRQMLDGELINDEDLHMEASMVSSGAAAVTIAQKDLNMFGEIEAVD